MPDFHAAKITVPSVSRGIVLRERLFQLLDTSLEKPVIWLTGPGGSGKTTLAATYLKSRKIPCIWYQIDDKDDNPATFFYYMGLARQANLAGGKKPLPLLTPEYLAGIKAFTRRYFEKLCQNLPAPFVIVLDNYQDVSPFASFHEIILEGISVIPKGVTVISLSRREPPPVFAVQENPDRFEFIGWNEIRFSFNEAEEFARFHSGDVFNAEALTRLYLKTDGWIAGLLLILETLGGRAIDCRLLDRLSVNEVFAYFADEIFSRTDRETREFLLKTAFVPGLTASMAKRLTGSRRAEQILSRLARNNLFTVKRSQADPVYEYHPLFREFLLAQAKKTFTETEASGIRRKAATLLQQSNRMEVAAGLFTEAADWEGLTQLIRQAAPALILEQGRSEVVRSWLESLPEGILESDPDLLFWHGACLMPVNATASRNSYQKAFDLFAAKNDRIGMLQSWSGTADVSLFEAEFEPMEKWLANLEILQIEEAGFPTPEIEAHFVMSIFNALSFGQPHHPDIAKWEERAYRLFQETSDVNLRVQSALYLVCYYLWMGRQSRAAFIVKQMQEIPPAEGLSPMTLIGIKVLRAFLSIFTAECESGIKAVLEALQIGEETGVHIWDNHILCHGVSLTLSMGDFVTTETLLNRLRGSVKGGKRFDVAYCEYICAWKEFLREDISSALEHLKPALELVNATRFMAAEGILIHGMVEVLRTKGDLEEAGAWLAKAYEIAHAMNSRYLEFVCLLDDALLAMDRQDGTRSLSLLRKALPIGREQGYANMHFWRPASMIRICEAALENEIEVDYIKGLVRKRDLTPAIPPLHIENWPWPIKIRTLGAFEILKDDKPLAFAGKMQKKPLELLKALISFGGKDVSDAHLADALWPEADGDFARRSFDTTLHRLRKLLGDDRFLQHNGGQLSIDPRHCWIDTQALPGVFKDIQALLTTSNGCRGENGLDLLLRKGSRLYRGDFLPADADQPWSTWMRENMRRRYLNILSKTGGYWESLEQWDKAIKVYLRALRLDNLLEESYQRLMVCYDSAGQTAEAVKTYRHCHSALSAHLAISPSPKTEAIYRGIIKKN